jgi:hypothetical protein
MLEIGRLVAGFMLGLLFDPEDGGSILLRIVWLSLNYTSLQHKRPSLHGKQIYQLEIFPRGPNVIF